MFKPLIRVTRASYGLTQFKSEFIEYYEADISVKDVTKFN